MNKETKVALWAVGIVFVLVVIGAGVWIAIGHNAPTPMNDQDSDQQAQDLGMQDVSLGSIDGTQSGSNAAAGSPHAAAALSAKAGDTITNDTEGFSTVDAGLQAKDVVEGTGAPVAAGQTVLVKYVGSFDNGQVFDSTATHGNAPFTFQLGAGMVIKGWDMGVVGMKPGGIRELIISPDLGYGPNDYGPIPGGSTLHFTVELIGLAQQ
ncbi:MAG TPA: FKBP-type peptidyl-prolyl cis-trans isomerase [Candidatus Paceibacterota bacterium]|nr:FKBP-type peptidyl-prolyl cis-trans isomerase [Candidatus Paceibacterota bacterium]